MPNDKISLRQFMALLFVALLSPAVTTLPVETAAIAASGAWLAPLVALPAALAVCCVVWVMFRTLPADAGLAEALEAAFGTVAGRTITGIYLIWCLLLLISNAACYGQRLSVAGYQGASLPLFLVTLLAVVLWLGLGKLTTLARSGEIFCLMLILALGAAVFLSLFHIKAAYILPLWIEDGLAIAKSAIPVLKVMSYAVFAGFLGGQVTRRSGNARRSVKWTVAFCGTLTLLLVTVLGQFGPTLTATMDTPFFRMMAGVGVRGAFQRLEAAASALWVLSDLTLMTLLTFSGCAMMTAAFRLEKGKWAAIPIVVLTFLGALAFAAAPKTAAEISSIAQTGSLILSLGLLPLVLFVLKAQKQT